MKHDKEKLFFNTVMQNMDAPYKEDFQKFISSHTLYIDTFIFFQKWDGFSSKGKNIKGKNFISMSARINGREICFDKSVRPYRPMPNRDYMTFGNKDNHTGVLVEITDEVWDEIKKNGYFDLFLEYTLFKNEPEEDKAFISLVNDTGEKIYIDSSFLSMRIYVENLEDGEHLLVATEDYGLSNPIAFFDKEDYENFLPHKEESGAYKEHISTYVPYCINFDTDTSTHALYQRLEFLGRTYRPYQNIKGMNGEYEALNLLGVIYDKKYPPEEKKRILKTVGVVSDMKATLREVVTANER